MVMMFTTCWTLPAGGDACQRIRGHRRGRERGTLEEDGHNEEPNHLGAKGADYPAESRFVHIFRPVIFST